MATLEGELQAVHREYDKKVKELRDAIDERDEPAIRLFKEQEGTPHNWDFSGWDTLNEKDRDQWRIKARVRK